MLTLYNVISSDGFIARNDDSEDFILDNLWKNFDIINTCLLEQFVQGKLPITRR